MFAQCKSSLTSIVAVTYTDIVHAALFPVDSSEERRYVDEDGCVEAMLSDVLEPRSPGRSRQDKVQGLKEGLPRLDSIRPCQDHVISERGNSFVIL